MYGGASKKILIIEDDLLFRNALRNMLASHSFDISTADDGEQAMERLLVHRPDLVILDLLLPKVHGFEVLKRIRAYPDQAVANLPVIVLSNLSSQVDMLEAKDLKVLTYFVKAHTNTEEILSKVKEILFGSANAQTGEVMDFTEQ